MKSNITNFRGLLVAAALTFTLGANAQEPTNLALSGTATASRAEGGNVATNANDGVLTSRWGSYNDPQDDDWIQIEWAEAQTFNTVKLLCEGAMNAANSPNLAFSIQTSNDGNAWTTQKSVTGQNAENNEYIMVAFNEVTAKFIRFQGEKRGTWGYSFYEFEVYNINYSDSKLTSLTVSPAVVKVGEATELTLTALDQYGVELTGATYITSNGALDGNKLTANAVGDVTISATLAGTTVTATIKATNIAAPTTNPTAPTAKAANVIAVYSATYGKGLTDNNKDWGIDGGAPNPLYNTIEEVEIADGHKVVHVNGAGFNSRTADIKGITADYNTIHVALYPFTATTARLFDDNNYANGIDVNVVPGQWNYIEVQNDNKLTKNYILVALEGETEFYLDHYYFEKPADNQAPTFDKAEFVSAGIGTVTIKFKANDNKSEIITYVLTDQDGKTYTVNGANNTEISAVIGSLECGKEYTFTIVAQDDNENKSDSKTVTATTLALTAAPTPAHNEDNVISLYSDAYKAAVNWKDGGWGQSTKRTEEIIGEGKVSKFTNFNYFGFDGFDKELDLSEMEYVHLDILPLTDLNLRFTPIMKGGTPTEAPTSVGELVVGQWNSIDLELSKLGLDYANFKSFQAKLDGGNGNDAFYLDNLYYWKGEAPDVVVTALIISAAETTINEGQTTSLSLKNQYNQSVAASAVAFTSDNEDVATVGANGVVTAVAEGVATITATYNGDNTIASTIEITVQKVSTSGKKNYEIPAGENAGKTLEYGWTFSQDGTDVTVTFVCFNEDEIVGITDGFIFIDSVEKDAGLSYTWTGLNEGDVVTVAHKWLFAGGDFITPDVTYTVQANGSYSSDDENENPIPTIVNNLPSQSESPVKVYSISGQYIGTFETVEKIAVVKRGLYIVNGKKRILK